MRSFLEKLEEHAILTELSKVVYERALLHDRGSWIAVLEPLFCRRCYSMDSLIHLCHYLLFLYFLSDDSCSFFSGCAVVLAFAASLSFRFLR